MNVLRHSIEVQGLNFKARTSFVWQKNGFAKWLHHHFRISKTSCTVHPVRSDSQRRPSSPFGEYHAFLGNFCGNRTFAFEWCPRAEFWLLQVLAIEKPNCLARLQSGFLVLAKAGRPNAFKMGFPSIFRRLVNIADALSWSSSKRGLE